MKKRAISGLCLAALFLCLALPAAASAQPQDSWVTLRIRDIGSLMNGLDEAVSKAVGQPGAPLPSDMVGEMVGKLSFVDPSRSVTVLVDVSRQNPIIYCLVPTLEESEQFRQAMKATAVEGGYVFTNPPNLGVPDDVLKRLNFAASEKMKDTLAIQLPMAKLLDSFGPKIDSGLDMLSQQAQGQDGIAAENLKKAVAGMLDIFKQAQALDIGLAWDDDIYRARFVARAAPGTELFRMLSAKNTAQSQLSGYQPAGIITVRTRPYDAAEMVKLMNSLYAALGMDISCINGLASMMTGEAAAGISFSGDRMLMEGMWVLGKDGTAEDFAAQWISCTEQMYSSMKAQMGPNAPPVPMPRKTADSTVMGKKVTGIRVNAPLNPQAGGGPSELSYDIRMAQVGNVMVFGPNDKAVARLIPQAQKLSPAPYDGPLMKMDMDLAALLRWAMTFEPEAPKLKMKGSAKLSCIIDAGGGKASAVYSIKSEDAKRLFAALEKLGPGRQMAAVNVDTGSPVDMPEYDGQEQADAPTADPAVEVLRKGNLAMVYGGPDEAVRLYREALTLAPENPVAHFNLANAYSEQEKYMMALAEADMALDLDPGNPDFLYGRARILLLSGDRAGALVGFTEAAAMGSGQAQAWLDRMASRR